MMRFAKWTRRGAAAAVMLCVLPFAGADDAGHAADQPLAALTIPSHTAKPSFMEMGVVKQWLVKPDDVVKKGQLLGREDTDVEEMKLHGLRVMAGSMAAVDAATADRDEKKVEYDNKQQGFAQQAASATEVEEAKLAYEQAKAQLAYAEVQHEKAIADADTEAKMIDKMQLLSPIDGTVEEISIHEGEVVDPNKPDGALMLVTNDPLWVEVKVPSAQALKLKVGGSASVAYQDAPNQWLPATVIYLDPEVDAASDKRTVRLALENQQNRPSGLWVHVKLSSDNGGH
jgi:RND family efflux transporter MFP subunit